MYAVFDQRTETRLQKGRPVVPVVQYHARRQRGLSRRDIVLHLLRDVQDILVAYPEYLDHGGKLAVETGLQQDFFETVVDLCDVGYADNAAVGVGLDHDIFKLHAPVGLSLGPDEHVTPVSANVAGRDIQRTALYGAGNIRQGQVEFPQTILGRFYTDLIFSDGVQRDLCNTIDTQ